MRWARSGRNALRTLAVLLVLATAAAGRARAAPHADETLTFSKFGTVHLYRPAGPASQVVLFVSGDGGWNHGVVDMARSLAGLGALVVGVDITHYLKQLAASKGPCSYPAADFEALSQFVQKKTLALSTYLPPILVGYSSGATLVYATLAESPPTTFRGAISLGFCPDLPLTRPLCKGRGLEWKPARPRGYEFLPAAVLETPWVALQGQQDQVCGWRATQEYVRRVGGAEIVLLPRVGHGFSVQRNWMPQFKTAFAGLAQRPSTLRRPTAEAVQDLPLVEVPASGHGDALAVIVSGDGGWASLDREIGDTLARSGVPVVGLDSLQYLWTRRTPDEAGRALERILAHYTAAWGKERAILIGYSLGADLLPFMVSRLPAELKERVGVVALLGPSGRVDFEFHLADWLEESAPSTALPVGPEVAKLSGMKVLCLYGRDEADSLCPEVDRAVAEPVELPGGHHFGGDYEGIGQRILQELHPDAR